MDETGGAVSLSKMPASGSVWAAKSHEGPEVLPFSQVIGLDGQSFADAGKRCKTPGLVAKTLRFTQGKQCKHLPVSTSLLCPHVLKGNAGGHTQFSKKSTKADRTGLLGNSDMFLQKTKRHLLLAFQNTAFQVSHKGARLLCDSVCLWRWIFFFNAVDKACRDAL